MWFNTSTGDLMIYQGGAWVVSTAPVDGFLPLTGGVINPGPLSVPDLYANTINMMGPSTMRLYQVGSDNTLQLSANFLMQIIGATSSFQLTAAGVPLMLYIGTTGQWQITRPTLSGWFSMRPSDNFIINNYAPMSGVGAYVNASDARIKEDIADEPKGLDAIVRLRPRRFRRKGQPGPRVAPDRFEVGFVADEVKDVLPDAVVSMEPDPDTPMAEAGGPVLGLQTDAIVAALVNAVRELSEKVRALEAR